MGRRSQPRVIHFNDGELSLGLPEWSGNQELGFGQLPADVSAAGLSGTLPLRVATFPMPVRSRGQGHFFSPFPMAHGSKRR